MPTAVLPLQRALDSDVPAMLIPAHSAAAVQVGRNDIPPLVFDLSLAQALSRSTVRRERAMLNNGVRVMRLCGSTSSFAWMARAEATWC